ncbi:unnamed protein product [Sphenostylis stenocarpa]|uniref:Uncharacterized protein n=1 Tax=Sphenostylis stenocarpa TaxID=92480 RepID=A0AA86SQ04_9FABA|nr:unnamed protein product [Sphenostylis stenocarpa]
MASRSNAKSFSNYLNILAREKISILVQAWDHTDVVEPDVLSGEDKDYPLRCEFYVEDTNFPQLVALGE